MSGKKFRAKFFRNSFGKHLSKEVVVCIKLSASIVGVATLNCLLGAAIPSPADLPAPPGPSRAATSEGAAFFEKKIRPVLTERCYECHSAGAKKIKGGLRADTRDALTLGGDGGPVIVPGEPDKSRLILAIRYSDEDLQMPPKEKLSPEQIADLEEKKLKPASPADKRTLLRRATFDWTGLPPKSEEIEAFLLDQSPEAFATVVDRLLNSRHFGERWGRHWLDVARYADSNGLEINLPYQNAWPGGIAIT